VKVVHRKAVGVHLTVKPDPANQVKDRESYDRRSDGVNIPHQHYRLADLIPRTNGSTLQFDVKM